MKEGASIMGKLCTSCGTALNEGAKFCTKCGANAAPVPEESGARSEQAAPKHGAVLTKVEKQIKNEVKTKASAYVQSVLSDRVPAFQSAGELALPSELSPSLGDFAGEGLLSLLKSGFRGLAGGFKKTLGNKKRLLVVIALAVVWLLVNLLAAFDIFSLPVRILSWLTAARGSLIGGSIGKGLVAALFAQVIADKGMLQSLKGGVGKLATTFKGGKKSYVLLLLGAGSGLIVCNLMISSNLQNSMICIAGFALSVKALTKNGFLQRLISELIPKSNNVTVTAVMSGWALGFAMFMVASLVPGRYNGYVFGLLLLIAGGIFLAVVKNKKTNY
jgi:hypothetical protein